MIEKVTFAAIDGTPLVGDLHLPGGGDARRPGVVILGPMTYCKEQAPTEYAKRLAAKGYVALAFDPRFRGESGGEPRFLESPTAKVDDVNSAVDFLASRDEVDPERIAALGICMGAVLTVTAVADNPGIRVFATVAGGYVDPETMLEWMSTDVLTARLARGVAAKEKFEATGEVVYDLVIDETRMDVAMPSKYVWDWYHPWADRGIWDNRYAVMSDAEVLTFDGLQASRRIQTPWLMVHSDYCTFPAAARRHFDAAPTADKKLVWEGETPHLAYYSDPEAIDLAVANVDDWFRGHLIETS